MEKLKYKTNIKCAGCVEKVTSYLDEVVGSNNWKVDTSSADKVLVIETNTASEQITAALAKAGYKAELLS